jgi:hypothetical protein
MGIKKFLIVLVIGAAFVVLLQIFMTGPSANGNGVGWQAEGSIALGIAGYIYYLIRKKAPKRVIGTISMIVGAVSNWIQIGRISNLGGANERFAFLVAGIALMAQGFKEVIDVKE